LGQLQIGVLLVDGKLVNHIHGFLEVDGWVNTVERGSAPATSTLSGFEAEASMGCGESSHGYCDPMGELIRCPPTLQINNYMPHLPCSISRANKGTNF
jgi:hypothetical protein